MANQEQANKQSQVSPSNNQSGQSAAAQSDQSQPAQGSATATAEKPQVDTSVLNQEEDQQYNSAAVNLASPGANIPEQESDESTAQNAPYQPETPPPEDASDNEQPSKLQATPPPPPPPSSETEVSPQQPQNNGKPWLIILAVVLVLALIGGGVWWYFASQAPDDEVTEEPAPEPDPEPEPEPDPEPPQVGIEPHTTEDSTPTISGTIDNPDAEIAVTVDGREYTATVDENGSWETTVSDELAPGTYTIHLSVTVNGEQFNDQLVNGLTIEEPEPEPQEDESEPEETPTTGPESEEEELPNTGPSDSKPPRQ